MADKHMKRKAHFAAAATLWALWIAIYASMAFWVIGGETLDARGRFITVALLIAWSGWGCLPILAFGGAKALAALLTEGDDHAD